MYKVDLDNLSGMAPHGGIMLDTLANKRVNFDVSLDSFLQQNPLTVMNGLYGSEVINNVTSAGSIYESMCRAGLIKNASTLRPAVRKPAAVPTGQDVMDTINQNKRRLASNQYDESVGRPIQVLKPIVSEVSERDEALAEVEQFYAQEPVRRPQRVADFSELGLDFLQASPAEPNICVTLELEQGEYESYYHEIIRTEYVFYFVFDRRWRYGRFKPKQSRAITTINVDGERYNGMFWADATFQLGILEITPFVVATEGGEEEKIADY
jgi:hypothetical protein